MRRADTHKIQTQHRKRCAGQGTEQWWAERGGGRGEASGRTVRREGGGRGGERGGGTGWAETKG
eukprot:3140985-Rhodomonas_salina.1